MIKLELFTEEKNNTKLAKSQDSPYRSIGLFLSPHRENNLRVNLCPNASQACIASCLNTAGLAGVYPTILKARKRKSNEFLADRIGFVDRLKKEIEVYKRRTPKGRKLVVRLNGTSDIDFTRYDIFNSFPNTQFYDYTKSPQRMSKFLCGNLPKNYHLTFSFSGENLIECQNVLRGGGSVATVFSGGLPTHWQGYEVIDGDITDLRFLDKQNVVVGLKAKGKAKNSVLAGSFVIQIDRMKGK